MSLEKELLRNLNGKPLSEMRVYQLKNLIDYKITVGFFDEADHCLDYLHSKLETEKTLWRFYK